MLRLFCCLFSHFDFPVGAWFSNEKTTWWPWVILYRLDSLFCGVQEELWGLHSAEEEKIQSWVVCLFAHLDYIHVCFHVCVPRSTANGCFVPPFFSLPPPLPHPLAPLPHLLAHLDYCSTSSLLEHSPDVQSNHLQHSFSGYVRMKLLHLAFM